MRARLKALVLASVLTLTACAGAPPPPAKTVSFRMTGHPDTATVTIDDHPIGPMGVIARRGIALPAGQHRISVEAPGYLPWDRIISAEDRPIAIEVNLTAIPE